MLAWLGEAIMDFIAFLLNHEKEVKYWFLTLVCLLAVAIILNAILSLSGALEALGAPHAQAMNVGLIFGASLTIRFLLVFFRLR